MNIKIPSGIILTLLLASILTLAFNIQVLEANPIPIPSIWMPEEYIDADISLVDGVVQARVNGTYPFAPLGTYYQVMMYYPVPPDADRITVEMNETKLDWTYGNETYPTVFGNWPMIIWDIAPVPEYFEIETYYEHPIPVIDGNYTFLYAMGTGKYLDYYTKETIAYVSVNISKHVADERNLIDVYTIGYNAMTEEWTWNPADYIITEEDETWIVTLAVISEMFHPLIEDLLITIKSEPTTWTVDDDGPADFSTIQEAINAASDGDTIFVYNGTYNERVVVNKTVALTGENRITTIINGRIYVDRVANNVEISGFTMGSGISLNSSNNVIHGNIMKDIAGIAIVTLVRTRNNTISNNLIVNNKDGIHAYGTDHLIQGNIIANNTGLGIHTIKGPQRSDKVRIIENNITNNGRGINICGYWNIVYKNIIVNNTGAGISLAGFTLKNMIMNNTIASNKHGIVTSGTHDDFHFIYGNVLSNNQYGIYLQYFCENNTIYGNTIEENELGVNLKYSDYNIVHHNNFIHNKEQLYIYQSSGNTWDNGTEGNYWSDYKGKDNDGDGIGDTEVPHLGVDSYPLMNPFEPEPIVPAIRERTVKVKTSDWVKYGSNFMSEGGIWLPPPEFPELPSGYIDIKNREWVKISVQNVSGTIITFEMISHFINGTEQTEIRYTDVDYGYGSLYWFVSADLEPGDNMYTTSRHLIEETVFRTYAGVTREVNHLTIETIYYKLAIWPPPDGPDKIVYDLYWDKSTGVLCEWVSDEVWMWGGEPLIMSWSIKMIDTNIWPPTRTWTVDDDGPADFSSIQEAINAAHSGDTIFVHSGTYYENVVVNKTVSLVGENKSTTAIDGNGTLVSIVDIVANNVVFRGFTIQNEMPVDYLAGGGICINDFDGAIIFDNIVANTQYGINLWNSTGNTIIGNYIKGNDVGIQFQFFSANNTISGNNIANNDYGIRTDWSPDNRFYHNNLMDNDLQVYKGGVLFSPNIWDIGYPLGGNYWDDYSGTDMYSGPHQNETSSDGIGDSAYEVTFSNTIPKISLHDNYPLMGMFHNFNISLDYYVNVISNSTVEDFEYFESKSTIKVHVSNITADQTHGFCRLTIPHDVLSPPYTVAINDDPVSYTTIFENDTLSIIYFSYEHSTLEIIISPELPPSDTTPPTITILSPENITYPANDVPLTFTASESISWIGYSLDGQANITIAGNTTLKGLSNGMYNLVVYAKDIPGNTGSSNTVYFTIQTTPTDTTPPGISIVSPENKTYYTTDIILTFIVDESVSWIAYSLDGQANVTITGITALTEVFDGSHSLILHARDLAGNTGASEMIHFSTDTQQPEPYISPEPAPRRTREPPFPSHLLITAAIVWIAAVGTILLLVYFAEIKK